MATTISVYTNDGCIGRCDGKCHEAKKPECKCICGGAFHGVGAKIAWEDRGTISAEEILQNAIDLSKGKRAWVKTAVAQLTLFANPD